MLVLYNPDNVQMDVFFNEDSPRAKKWLDDMPAGWTMEFVPNELPNTPGKLVAKGR